MADPNPSPASYRDAGVDRDAAARAKELIARLVQTTNDPHVLSEPGAFAGLFRLPAGPHTPVLAASADGVGTKIKVAIRAGRHDTLGHDLVNHCTNDILVQGARPLFFLDYIALGRLDEAVVAQLVAGIAAACRANGCVLLGGETAEMPDLYAPGDYDLAGFIVGIADEHRRPGRHRVRPGDRIVALPSNGFHTNGYSLLRRLLFDRLGLTPTDPFPDLDATVADVLLRTHRSYLHALGPLLEQDRIHALAHITGGGIPENLARILPAGLQARVHTRSWEPPPEFRAVMRIGAIEPEEMFRTFNMGVGMILVVAPEHADPVLADLHAAGEHAWIAGEVAEGRPAVLLV